MTDFIAALADLILPELMGGYAPEYVFSLSYLVEMGWDDLGVYAKYTPTPLFKNDKGPVIQLFSAGLSLKF